MIKVIGVPRVIDRPMTAKERGERLEALGYVLTMHKLNVINGKTYKYRTSPGGPNGGSGSVNYFDDIQQVEKYIRTCEVMRHWQDQPLIAAALGDIVKV